MQERIQAGKNRGVLTYVNGKSHLLAFKRRLLQGSCRSEAGWTAAPFLWQRRGKWGGVSQLIRERYGGGRLPSETSGTQGLSRDGFGLWFLPTQSQPPVADIASICLQIKSVQVHRPLILCPGVTYPSVLSRGPRRTCSCALCPFHSWKNQGMVHSTQQPHGAHAPSAQHHL